MRSKNLLSQVFFTLQRVGNFRIHLSPGTVQEVMLVANYFQIEELQVCNWHFPNRILLSKLWVCLVKPNVTIPSFIASLQRVPVRHPTSEANLRPPLPVSPVDRALLPTEVSGDLHLGKLRISGRIQTLRQGVCPNSDQSTSNQLLVKQKAACHLRGSPFHRGSQVKSGKHIQQF